MTGLLSRASKNVRIAFRFAYAPLRFCCSSQRQVVDGTGPKEKQKLGMQKAEIWNRS
jgi:hypothetical protein